MGSGLMSHDSSEAGAEAIALIDAFFDPAVNQVTLDEVEGNELFRRMVERVRSGRSTVLPFRAPSVVPMYVVAVSENNRLFSRLYLGLRPLPALAAQLLRVDRPGHA